MDIGADKQVIRGSGLIGSGDSGPPTLVDVKDGRITRIRPLDYESKYDKKDFNAWKMEAKGKTLDPPLRASLGPIGQAYKKRVYSKNRVRYPLKRVDWDPGGAPGSVGPGGRNTQNRGTSKYVRISWDEAAELVAAELRRMKQDLRSRGRALPGRHARRDASTSAPATAAPTGCSRCWAATPSRCATWTAGKARTGAPSTCGAASRWGR